MSIKNVLKFLNRVNFLTRSSIRYQLMTSFVIIVILSSIFIILFYFNNMNLLIKDQVYTYNSEIIKQVGKKLDYLFEQIKTAEMQLIGVAINSSVFNQKLDELSMNKAEYVKSIEENLKSIRRSFQSIYQVYLIGFNDNAFSSSVYFIKNRLLQKKWINSVNDADLTIPGHISDYEAISNEGIYVVSFIKKIRDIMYHNKVVGMIQIDMKYSEIKNAIENINTIENSLIFLVDSNKNVVYYPGGKYNGQNIDNIEYEGLNSRNTEGFTMYANSSDALLIDYDIKNIDWRIICIIPTANIGKYFNEANRVSIYITAISIIFALLLSYYLSKSITRPISHLVMTMRKAGDGMFDINIPDFRNKDLFILSNAFRIMLGKINGLMKILVEKETSLLSANIKTLQAQINPHFLYNTLETIRSIALRNNVKSIVDISKSMAMIFRYSINDSKKYVQLSEELENIKCYIRIQKYRYGDKFKEIYDIDESLLQCSILKFIIQPLVENSIYHGIELKKDKGTIVISCIKDNVNENIMLIKIADNGLGMEPETVAEINGLLSDRDQEVSIREPEKDKAGIGILNVHTRIGLHYGRQYGLRLFSEKGKGTIVEIRIPVFPNII